jgi:uncharacterized protein
MRFADAWVMMPVLAKDDLVPRRADDPLSRNMAKWFHRQSDKIDQGSTIDDVIADMDACGIEKALLSARHYAFHPDSRPRGVFETTHGMSDEAFDMFMDEQAEAIARYPGRLYGSVMIDCFGVMRSYRQLERAVKDYGCKAIRVMGAFSGVSFTHPLFYPIYAKCAELDVPVTINIGVPGPSRSASTQRPIDLDDILLAFPELTVVGAHIGHPWHLETLAMLQKHDNFYLMTSGFAPKYVPAEIIQYMNSRGPHKVMWASDRPLISMERATQEAQELPLKEEVLKRYAYDNLVDVMRLD